MLKTDMLVVTAHPDDESMMGATMARYADKGKVVALVTCTHGEGGGNGTGREGGAALGAVRETELRKCVTTLGVRHLYFLNQPDWAYTESVQATFAKWGHDETLKRLVRLVRLLRPEVICTMDPTPVGGQHGHHQAAGRLATEAFDAAADPAAFSELDRDEGVSPWRVRKLYWSSFGGAATVQIATDATAGGTLQGPHAGERYGDIARKAARQHRSQGFDKFFAIRVPTTPLPARPNGFLLVKSRVLINPRAEKDLFDGLAGVKLDGPETQHDVLAGGLTPPPVTPLTAQLRPRENVRAYRAWLLANGIARLSPRLPVHATVVRGRDDNVLEIEVTNSTPERQSGNIQLESPGGWTFDKQDRAFSIAAHATTLIPFRCAVPADAAVKSHDLIVRLGDTSSTGKLDVVPTILIKRLVSALPVNADVKKWESAGVEPVPITHTNVVQGSVQSPEQCSGRFFAGYDATGLQVLIDVRDDMVARNISPDDIKAHWRSTSVEICVDPSPRSENTFTTFKLGVFPQDTGGTVRGARDADARPGPLEQVHSKIELSSHIKRNGYVVEAHIPWAEIGVVPGRAAVSGTALGMNVVLYHAGKKVARIGEDIGQSRLAWSFWRSVPGRPEVWGSAFLE